MAVAVVLLLPVVAAMVVELLARGHVPLPLVLVHELLYHLVLGGLPSVLKIEVLMVNCALLPRDSPEVVYLLAAVAKSH